MNKGYFYKIFLKETKYQEQSEAICELKHTVTRSPLQNLKQNRITTLPIHCTQNTPSHTHKSHLEKCKNKIKIKTKQ